MLLKPEDKSLSPVKVFGLVDHGTMSLTEAAELTGYSYCHLTRLYRRYRRLGLKHLFQPHHNRPPIKVSPQQVAKLKDCYLALEKPQLSQLLYFFTLDYPDFPPISREWTRRILTRKQVYSPGKQGKVFRRRFEAPAPGILVQGDSTSMRWIPGDNRYYQFLAFTDDRTLLCLGARLIEHDTVVEHDCCRV